MKTVANHSKIRTLGRVDAGAAASLAGAAGGDTELVRSFASVRRRNLISA
jgi:hypothetical protein